MACVPPVIFVAESRQDERSRGGGTIPQRGVLCGMIQGTGRLQVTGFGKLRFRETPGSVSSSFVIPFSRSSRMAPEPASAHVNLRERMSRSMTPHCFFHRGVPPRRSGACATIVCLQQQNAPPARSRLMPGVPSTASHAIAVASTRERAFLSAPERKVVQREAG